MNGRSESFIGQFMLSSLFCVSRDNEPSRTVALGIVRPVRPVKLGFVNTKRWELKGELSPPLFLIFHLRFVILRGQEYLLECVDPPSGRRRKPSASSKARGFESAPIARASSRIRRRLPNVSRWSLRMAAPAPHVLQAGYGLSHEGLR